VNGFIVLVSLIILLVIIGVSVDMAVTKIMGINTDTKYECNYLLVEG